MPAASGGLAPRESRLVFVPFADAIEYRVWTARSRRLRLDEPAVTAFERAAVSPDNLRPGADPLEAITDENPSTFCICDPRSYGVSSIARGTLGKLGEPVSFSVILNSKTRISRIVFRHGTATEKGGWFDTSGGRPYVEISRTPKHWDGLQDQLNWERVAEVDSYPLTNAQTNPQLSDGQLFQVALPGAYRSFLRTPDRWYSGSRACQLRRIERLFVTTHASLTVDRRLASESSFSI